MNRKTEAARQLTEWAAVNAKRNQVVCGALLAGITKTEIHTITGIARTTIDRILEPIMTVTLYELLGPTLVIARGEEVWEMGSPNDYGYLVGTFAADAQGWVEGDWEPEEGEFGQHRSELNDDLTAVAEWTPGGGVRLLVEAEHLGLAAQDYLGASAFTSASDWADALDAQMKRTDQTAGDLISFGYANGQILGVTLDPEHLDADDERGVIASDTGWIVGYDAQSGYWTAR